MVAAVARAVDAGKTHQLFGDGHVRQLADVLGGDGLDHQVRAALDADRVAQRGADAGDDNLVDLGGVVGGGGLLGPDGGCGEKGGQRYAGGGDGLAIGGH